LVGSFAQLLITIVAGTVGFLFLKSFLVAQFPQLKVWFQFIVYGLIIVILLMGLIYFNVSSAVRLFNKWFRKRKYVYLLEALQSFHQRLLLQLLFLSLLRYLIFIIQYALIFYLFEVNVPVVIIAAVMSVVFLAMAIIPSIALVEVWLRGEISIKLMGLFSLNTLGIGFTSVTVWFINLILPAIAGSLLLLGLRVFKNEGR
jgi:hypothetical protein